MSLVFFWACTKKNTDTDDGQDNDPKSEIELYLTTANKSYLFKKIPLNYNTTPNMSPYTVALKPDERYQIIDGFGAALTGSSCYNLLKMGKENRTVFLKSIFDPKLGLNFSYIRVSIGCSDFSLDEYSCQEQEGKENFALPFLDRRDLLPVLKEILAINPKIKIMGSPWTAPRWMKVNNLKDLLPYNSWTGGQLNPLYYKEYAEYFAMWIKAMEKEEIPIESITIQNEPLNRGNSASMYMSWEEQTNFIKTALGPVFEKEEIKTKIVVYDHNYNYDDIQSQVGYPKHIYADPDAAKYVDGAAFHAYGGDKSELLNVHNSYPEKNLYFTEMSIGTWGGGFESDLLWNMREVFIGAVNNWSKSVVVWNLMLDDKRGPNRPGGCQTCYGVVDINSSDYKAIVYQSFYYNLAHMSKVINPGAVRIATSGYKPSGFIYTAVKNPDSTYGIVAQNDNGIDLSVTFALGDKSFSYLIPPMSIVSFKF